MAGENFGDLANLKQFAKVLPVQIYILKTADSRLPKYSPGKNAHGVYLEILLSFEGEARSPRSHGPLRETVPPTAIVEANVKVNEAELKKSASVERTHF